MYGFKCKKCGGMKVNVENECDCISKENENQRDTIKNQRELLIDAEKRGEMKAIVQYFPQFHWVEYIL
jgi:hypothetical protein